MKQKVTMKGEDKRVWMPGISEFIAITESESSDAENPLFEDIAGAEVPRDAPGGVGTTLTEKVEVKVKEEEVEDPNVHFKRKQKGRHRRKRVVKKSRRQLPLLQRANRLRLLLLLP